VEVAGLKDELLVLREAHVGVLGAGIGGVGGADPPELLCRAAAHELLEPGAAGLLEERGLRRVDLAEVLGIELAPEANLDVDLFVGLDGEGGAELDLVVAAVGEQDLGELLGAGEPEWVAACLEHGLRHRLDGGHGDGLGGDGDQVSGLDLGGEVDEDFGELCQAGVAHGGPQGKRGVGNG
jgi:hypothetical protein